MPLSGLICPVLKPCIVCIPPIILNCDCTHVPSPKAFAPQNAKHVSKKDTLAANVGPNLPPIQRWTMLHNILYERLTAHCATSKCQLDRIIAVSRLSETSGDRPLEQSLVSASSMTISKRSIKRRFVQERARFNAAVDAFNEGSTLRGSAKLAHMPLTTFRRKLQKQLNQNAGMKHQQFSLTFEEEQCKIDLICEYASRGKGSIFHLSSSISFTTSSTVSLVVGVITFLRRF